MLININQIKVTDRIRKDFGNIEELAQDINDNGLINPPVVTPEFELIAGERRLRAMKYLGYQQIEVRVMTVKDALHQLKLEISENENRKDFSFSEKMEWAEKLKDEYEKIAKENMAKGGQGRQISDTLRTDDTVAQEVGLGSRDTFRKAEYIYQNADEEMIKQLDEGNLSINKAYITLKERAKQLEQANQVLENTYNELSGKYQQINNELNVLKNKPSEVVEVIVEVDNTDYNKINQLTKQLEFAEKQKVILEREVKLNESEAKAYKELKESIDKLKLEREDIHRQIESATSISKFVVDIEDTLQTKLAPIKYSRAISEQLNNEVVINNILEIVGRVEDWCMEMRELISKDENVINIEYTEVE